MKISENVSIHNSEKYVERCIDSILLPTYQDWEANLELVRWDYMIPAYSSKLVCEVVA